MTSPVAGSSRYHVLLVIGRSSERMGDELETLKRLPDWESTHSPLMRFLLMSNEGSLSVRCVMMFDLGMMVVMGFENDGPKDKRRRYSIRRGSNLVENEFKEYEKRKIGETVLCIPNQMQV